MYASVSVLLLRFFCFLFIFSCACTGFAQESQRKHSEHSQQNSFARPLADVHLHTRNYVQKGKTLKETYITLTQYGVKRTAAFGIPLQQRWDMGTKVAPSYYLHDDQPLYYYSAIDAIIAVEYLSLSSNEKEMFDPMIVGFNPSDGWATDHIKNMLLTFPGVFTGIGEFSIKKEVVSSKIGGSISNIEDPALGKILDFAAEVGLVAILHCDLDAMSSNNKKEPTYLSALKKLFRKHRKTSLIWAHTGLGRYVKARKDHTKVIASLLSSNPNLYVDISWDLVAKQFFKGKSLDPKWKKFLEKYSHRILYGSDVVAPTPKKYAKVLSIYNNVWSELSDKAVKNITYNNYKKLFNKARKNVRAWEKKNLPKKIKAKK